MEKIENNISKVWNEIVNQVTVNLGDINKLEYVFSKAFIKIQRQRERLEKSRDMWKKKFEELKCKSK